MESKFKINDYIQADGVGKIIGNNTLEIGIGLPKTQSHLKVGNLVIHNTKHFNWFHRKMWKLLLGFDIENVK